MPEDRAPNIKYLTPDSAELIESLFIAAATYKDKLCNSIARYIDIKLFEEIINNIPRVENKNRTGISKFLSFTDKKYSLEIKILDIEPKITKILKNL